MKNMLKTMQDLLEEYYESFGMERSGKSPQRTKADNPRMTAVKPETRWNDRQTQGGTVMKKMVDLLNEILSEYYTSFGHEK